MIGGDAANDPHVPPTPAHRRRGRTHSGDGVLYSSNGADEAALLLEDYQGHHVGIPVGPFDDGRGGSQLSSGVGGWRAWISRIPRQWPSFASTIPTGVAASTPAAGNGPTVSDKLSRWRMSVLATPTFTWSVVIATVVLLIVPLVSPPAATTWSYFIAEFVLTALFCLEVGVRLLLMRGSFWSSPVNAIETVMCVVCVFTFLAMCVTTPRKSEPIIVASLRLLSQVMRAITYCHQRRIMHPEMRPLRLNV
jgi:hypothetical protein